MKCNGHSGFWNMAVLLAAGMLGWNGPVVAEEVADEQPRKVAKPASLEKPRQPALPAPSKEVLEALLKMHNETRARNGLAALRLHPKLTAAAQRYADYSYRTQRFGHYADGRSPADRIAAEGLAFGSWAENMAWGQQSPEEAVETWINSGGHYSNMLSPHTHVGFGQVGAVWVTVFANPAELEEKK